MKVLVSKITSFHKPGYIRVDKYQLPEDIYKKNNPLAFYIYNINHNVLKVNNSTIILMENAQFSIEETVNYVLTTVLQNLSDALK